MLIDEGSTIIHQAGEHLPFVGRQTQTNGRSGPFLFGFKKWSSRCNPRAPFPNFTHKYHGCIRRSKECACKSGTHAESHVTFDTIFTSL